MLFRSQMSVLVNKDSKIIVQGFTGSEGTFHAGQMIDYGTNVVGGVTPGKGGQEHLGKPVFNTVADAVEKAAADTSIIFVSNHLPYTPKTSLSVLNNLAARLKQYILLYLHKNNETLLNSFLHTKKYPLQNVDL